MALEGGAEGAGIQHGADAPRDAAAHMHAASGAEHQREVAGEAPEQPHEQRDGGAGVRIARVRTGAAGIPTPPALLAAAEVPLASLPWDWNTSHPFKHNLTLSTATKLGRCTLLQPWVVGHERGALFHARCEAGNDAVLRLGLNRDGTISLAELFPAQQLYKGPPIAGPDYPAQADEPPVKPADPSRPGEPANQPGKADLAPNGEGDGE